MSLKDLKEKYDDYVKEDNLNCSKDELNDFENYGIIFKALNRRLHGL